MLVRAADCVMAENAAHVFRRLPRQRRRVNADVTYRQATWRIWGWEFTPALNACMYLQRYRVDNYI